VRSRPKDAAETIERDQLFDRAARGELLRAHGRSSPSRPAPAVVAGQRRSFDVITVPAARGSAGIGIDATETERMRAELARMMDAHRRTLDQLATGVAIFGSDHRLGFYNAAYRLLWDLDVGFLDQGRLIPPCSISCAPPKLPDEQDFRQWKSSLHVAIPGSRAQRHIGICRTGAPCGSSPRPIEAAWSPVRRRHRAPGSRAPLRCPDPLRGETLDNLTEAVAVFGGDGRLRLTIRSLPRCGGSRPKCCPAAHIEGVSGWTDAARRSRDLAQAPGVITAMDNRRRSSAGWSVPTGTWSIAPPLPDGATLVTTGCHRHRQ
jgi:hypothetical protein